jgi:hypothetical protein
MIALLDLNDTFESDPDIERWWPSKSPALSALARTWYDVMKDCGPDVRESLHNGYPAACLDRYPFTYVDAFTAHVNVGFYCGAFLPDPEGLLIGSGKRMRHVKLWPDTDTNEKALKALIEAAYRDMKQRLQEMRKAT